MMEKERSEHMDCVLEDGSRVAQRGPGNVLLSDSRTCTRGPLLSTRIGGVHKGNTNQGESYASVTQNVSNTWLLGIV